MGKFEKKKTRGKGRGVILVLLLAVVVIALALFVMPQILYKLSGEEESAIGEEIQISGTGEADPAQGEAAGNGSQMPDFEETAFPLMLENGKLKVDSVFQYDGMNPDCANLEGSNIATVTVSNLSDTYLERAEISVAADTGDVLRFVVMDLPAGDSALVFSADNASVAQDSRYGAVNCEAVFQPDASRKEDRIAVSVEGTKITLKNQTDTQIDEIVVYCRALLGDQFFGGIAYTYPVNNLPAKGSAEIDAVDCFLGMAEVTRIEINE